MAKPIYNPEGLMLEISSRGEIILVKSTGSQKSVSSVATPSHDRMIVRFNKMFMNGQKAFKIYRLVLVATVPPSASSVKVVAGELGAGLYQLTRIRGHQRLCPKLATKVD